MPGTHKEHETFSSRHPHADVQGDFLPVPHDDALLERKGYMLRVEPGDLILWDSRTIHCNGPALHPPSTAPAGIDVPASGELLRLAGYVCFTPASVRLDCTEHMPAELAPLLPF
jgi:hypothetical protein